LASFLGGLAVGAFLIGRWADRRRPSLLFYGTLELCTGIYCLFVPAFYGFLTNAYVALYHRWSLGPVGLIGLRVSLAAVLILIPAFLMGGTLPAIARFLAATRSDFQPELDRFYAFNTLGGAIGVLVSTYLLIPSLGIPQTIWSAAAINIGIFFTILYLSRGCAVEWNGTDINPNPESPFGGNRRLTFLLAGSFLTGVVALAYEIVWTHALSFLIGNTVYAFGLMLFTFLCGLGIGARIVARRWKSAEAWGRVLAISQLLLGLTVFVTLPLWPRIPALFSHGISGAYDRDLGVITLLVLGRITYVFWRNRKESRTAKLSWYRTHEPHIAALVFALLVAGLMPLLWRCEPVWFIAGELLRFFCVFGLLIVPSLLLGLTFPLLLNLYSIESQRVGSSVGKVYAVNTIGTVVGSLVTGFFVLPRFGSSMTLRACAALNVGLALAFALSLCSPTRKQKATYVLAGLVLAALFIALPMQWDVRHVTGSYAYFNEGWPGAQVVYAKEDVQGGLTSVVQAGATRTLLSNGKFQGDNTNERSTQARFALIPSLFMNKWDRALIIGLGTGHVLSTAAKFPFQRIDVAELAPHVVEAARLWFQDVNGGILDSDPRLHVSVADGRNFLLLSRDKYDMITVEITSLWISGEADLYNEEFYQLCKSHLTEHGVLQQWVALHHLRTQDLLIALNTAAQVFPHVALFQGENQGHAFLIASSAPLEIDYQVVAEYGANPKVREELNALGMRDAWPLLGEVVLHGSGFRDAIASLHEMTGLRKDFASTDFHPYLEYHAPKGVVVPYDTVVPNTLFLRKFRPDSLSPDLIKNVPSENERKLVLGYVAEKRGNLARAQTCFEQVEGTSKAEAQSALERITQELSSAQSQPARDMTDTCK
jgi:spermidine synthase